MYTATCENDAAQSDEALAVSLCVEQRPQLAAAPFVPLPGLFGPAVAAAITSPHLACFRAHHY